ncbi:MAG: ester cyclase [Chitinophagales bacterium]|jgi:predicted ester cyclase|nr:ester cyclase [Chitinophagales bacterium]HNI43737.1 ester cyclase [Chitinophagales bacterium]
MSSLKSVVEVFYQKCLTVNTTTNPTEVLENLLADDFLSKNAAGEKPKKSLIGQIGMFWKIMPDMKWEIQETIEQGNQIVVRSLFSASPRGNFKGVECDGTKSFKTMAIDIHTIENGQIKQVYHCEEWETAIEQLKK